MPFYDYKCKKCGTEFSDLKKIEDRHVPETTIPCMKCDELELELVIATPAIVTDSMRL